MEALALLVFIFLVVVVTGIVVALYFVLGYFGYRKTGAILLSGYCICIAVYVGYGMIKDYLFTKNNAREMLAEHQIVLKDDFKMISNQSSEIMDYEHTFVLAISRKDKEHIIELLQKTPGFDMSGEDITTGKEGKLRYKDDDSNWVYQYYKHGGRRTSIVHTITVTNIGDTLKFDDRDCEVWPELGTKDTLDSATLRKLLQSSRP